MKHFTMTPIRRLEGVAYWVVEDRKGIYDFINTEIRKEWEVDARFEGRDPKEDTWLKTLSKRQWSLQITEIDQIRLNPRIMNYVDDSRDHNFSDTLTIRSDELRKCIQEYAHVIWPVIIRSEDFMLVDGYCRYTVLKKMNKKRIYTYVGIL